MRTKDKVNFVPFDLIFFGAIRTVRQYNNWLKKPKKLLKLIALTLFYTPRYFRVNVITCHQIGGIFLQMFIQEIDFGLTSLVK